MLDDIQGIFVPLKFTFFENVMPKYVYLNASITMYLLCI